MTAAQTAPPPITGDKLVELMGLIRGADSVELKLTVPDAAQRSAVVALGLDPLDAEIRQVFFFDTPDLALYEHGLVVRARRVQRKGDDSVVKLRPVDPSALPAELRATPGFGVEVDAMPGGFVCSASLKSPAGRIDVRRTVTEGRPLRKLFSKPQRALFTEHAPDGVGLDDLAVLGPIFVLKLRFSPPALGRRLVAEVWLYPDDSRILELSTKCRPPEAFLVAAQARAFLSSHGISLDEEQATKTRRALELFARAAPAPAAQ
jgi:hypothetical protein